jgi:hypothetical protein
MAIRCECDLIGCDGEACMPSERFMKHHYGASGYVDPKKSIVCVCGHKMDEHAQYQWSCFVRECDCIEFRISDGPRAKQHVNRIVLSLQRNGYSGPETLKDYLEALDVLLAVVTLEAKAGLSTQSELPEPRPTETRKADVQGIAAIAWRCIKQCKNYEGPPVMCPAHQQEAHALVGRMNQPHTCHGNEHMPPGPCVACEEEKLEDANVSGAARSDSVAAEGVTAGETAHYFTPDPTKRFCVICGDNDLGSVWGIHRFQIQPGDPDFKP